jgi:uncharacterized protein YecE (DUF72 family)
MKTDLIPNAGPVKDSGTTAAEAHPADESALQRKAEHRARREARRAKQREQNVHRAAKMRLARITGAAASDDRPPPALPALNVGCSGWFYWHWRETFYPRDLPTKAWFPHYADRFKTVELNAPFYSWPTVGTVQSWNRQAGRRRFVYTVKVSELITHVKRFVGTKRLVQDFGHIADLLGPRMGCFLFQLPPSFRFTPARLKAILSQLDANRRNVIEFRHKSWWQEPVFEAFREAGAIFCSCSGPRLPDQLVKTADDVYIRFHGTSQWYRHDYTGDELQVWADRIRDCGAKRVWAYFNNDRDGNAVRNAKEFLRRLKRTDAKR